MHYLVGTTDVHIVVGITDVHSLEGTIGMCILL